MTNTEMVIIDVAARDADEHGKVADVLVDLETRFPMDVTDLGDAEPVGVGWPLTHRVRVATEHGLEVCQEISEAVAGSAFNIRSA